VSSPIYPFERFLKTLTKATNEQQKREAFVVLAAQGFGDSELATDLALGAEYRVRFSAAGLTRRGAVDSFFGNLIVEFEKDLSNTYDHALQQLRAYVAGAWREDSSTARAYLAIATDGANWHVFAPRLVDIEREVSAENIELDPVEQWSPSDDENDPEALRDFLNRLLFRTTWLRPTSDNFVSDFGLASPAFLSVRTELYQKLRELENDSQLEVLRNAWRDSLQIAYGSIETDDALFVKHTYLALLARLLVWAALERRWLRQDEIHDVLSGIYFKSKHVTNLVEDDFFQWYNLPTETDALRAFVALSKQLAGYDLASIQEDILKPLYEQLVDPVTRHELGEFYTPDWLALRIVNHVLQNHDWSLGAPAAIDPACGSGTFLRTLIEITRTHSVWNSPKAALEDIRSQIVGIDVHPLAVIVARATYLLAIKDLLPHADSPIAIPVYLANALSMPPIARQLTFGRDEFRLKVDAIEYNIPSELIYNGADHDDTIEDVLTVARSYGNASTALDDAPASLRELLGDSLVQYANSDEVVSKFGEMAKHIARLIRERRNSVHGFLLRNHYRPSMLRGRFAYVVGNPPWLTVASIATPSYKEMVITLATDAAITSRSHGEQSHTELATIFLAAATEHFIDPTLPPAIRVGFVMPRSVMTAKHHGNLRQAKYNARFDVAELWDLDGVTPLFNIPACVLFAAPGEAARPTAKKPGLRLSGRLKSKDAPEKEVCALLQIEKVEFALDFLGKRSTWRVVESGEKTSDVALKRQPYVNAFRQGAVMYPQTLFVVRADDGFSTHAAKTVHVTTDPDAASTAKVLKDARVNHIVETSTLFSNAAADHLLPYAMANNRWTVILPVTGKPGDPSFEAVSADTLRRRGRLNTAGWLDWAEAQWQSVRKSDDPTPLYERLDYAGPLSGQSEMAAFTIIYTAAGNRTVAAVVDNAAMSLPFVARDRTYWASFGSCEEADYLAGFLNSDFSAEYISDFINRGLFGPRDINKRILDVPWPHFDREDALHLRLAKASRELALAASSLLRDLAPSDTGRQRKWVRAQLPEGTKKVVEVLVGQISRGAEQW
jgi:type I restriction-modification system DNA methylase subunit